MAGLVITSATVCRLMANLQKQTGTAVPRRAAPRRPEHDILDRTSAGGSTGRATAQTQHHLRRPMPVQTDAQLLANVRHLDSLGRHRRQSVPGRGQRYPLQRLAGVDVSGG
jgi:hypothetical protein